MASQIYRCMLPSRCPLSMLTPESLLLPACSQDGAVGWAPRPLRGAPRRPGAVGGHQVRGSGGYSHPAA